MGQNMGHVLPAPFRSQRMRCPGRGVQSEAGLPRSSWSNGEDAVQKLTAVSEWSDPLIRERISAAFQTRNSNDSVCHIREMGQDGIWKPPTEWRPLTSHERSGQHSSG